MNLSEHAKWLAEALAQQAEETAKTIDHAVENTKNTTAAIAASGMTAIENFKEASDDAIQQGVNTVNQTVDTLKLTTSDVTASGFTTIEHLKEQSKQTTEYSLNALSKAIEDAQINVIGMSASGVAIANSLKDLPRTVEELAKEMPKLALRLRTAGVRIDDTPRSSADMMGLFDKIPGTSKLGANERTIREFLSDKHGSHVKPHSQGGGNGANNVVWEIGADNIRRGARTMTGGEQIYIRVYNAVDSILKNSAAIAKLGIAATGTAILTQAVVTAVSYSLDLYRGDISIDEYRDRIFEAAISAGIMAPIFFLILIAVLALFPELTILLSAPVVVAGFNALFGISVATPIIQSLIRHLEAGGFGEEIAEGYQSLTIEAQNLLETSTNEIRQFCEEISLNGTWGLAT
ncbi:MAG: HNH endonuclease [Elainellaceae cyanobacterium]